MSKTAVQGQADSGFTSNSREADVLSLRDRCEGGCTQPGRVLFAKSEDDTFVFCGHHANRHEEKLRAIGYQVKVDDRAWNKNANKNFDAAVDEALATIS